MRARATLDKLQAQLILLPRPTKLHKDLTSLSALTLSAYLLADFRLNKALRTLRDYQQPATMAAHLLDQWSPLLDAQSQDEPSKPSPSKHQGQKRSREAHAENCNQQEPMAPSLGIQDAIDRAPQGLQRTVPPLKIKLRHLLSGATAAGSPNDCPHGPADSESQAPAGLSWEDCLDYQLPLRKKERTDSAQADHCAENLATETRIKEEPWRNSYLRFQLVREQHLQTLTLNFRSACLTNLQDESTKMNVFDCPAAKHFPLPKRSHVNLGEAVQEETHNRSAPASKDCKRASRSNDTASRTLRGLNKATLACPYLGTAQPVQGLGKRKPKKQVPPLMVKSIKEFRRFVSGR